MKKTTKKQHQKITKPSKKKIHRTKKLVVPERANKWEEYREVGSWKMKPYNDQTLERLANELMTWVNTTESLYLERFYLGMNISNTTWNKFLERSEPLRLAEEQARRIMGIKREEAAHDRKADRQVLEWRQLSYSREFKEYMEWKSGMRQKEQEAGASNYTVELAAVPNSDMVPEKKPEST